MAADIQELIKEPAFIIKVVELLCCLLGIYNLLTGPNYKSIKENLVVCVALGGGLIGLLMLIALYIRDETNETVETMILATYGLMNLIACYIFYSKYTGCRMKVAYTLYVKLGASSMVGALMLGEVLVNNFVNK